jgi:hypothetical protein
VVPLDSRLGKFRCTVLLVSSGLTRVSSQLLGLQRLLDFEQALLHTASPPPAAAIQWAVTWGHKHTTLPAAWTQSRPQHSCCFPTVRGGHRSRPDAWVEKQTFLHGRSSRVTKERSGPGRTILDNSCCLCHKCWHMESAVREMGEDQTCRV